MTSQMISFRMNEENLLHLNKVAELTQRSKSNIINEAVALYFENDKALIEHIHGALQNVKKGQTITHEVAMQRLQAAIINAEKAL